MGSFGGFPPHPQNQMPNMNTFSINLGQMVNQVNQLLNTGGLQQYLNTLIGETNLLPATPR